MNNVIDMRRYLYERELAKLLVEKARLVNAIRLAKWAAIAEANRNK